MTQIMDQVSEAIIKLGDIAIELGSRYHVSGLPYIMETSRDNRGEVSEVAVAIRRWSDSWGILYRPSGKDVNWNNMKGAAVHVKCAFIFHAEAFFKAYLDHAQEVTKNAEKAVDLSPKIIEAIRSMIPPP